MKLIEHLPLRSVKLMEHLLLRSRKLIEQLPLRSVMVKRSLIVLIPAALLAMIFSWSFRSPSEGRNLATVVAKPGPFTAKISETGELRALESVTISGQKELPIIYLVPEGTFVKEGDVLVRFDSSKYELAIDESKASLQVAEADLRRAREDSAAQRNKLLAELARFEAEVLLAQLDLDNLRKKPLKDELEGARMELEKAKVAFENAEKKLSVLPELVEKGFVTRITLEEAQLQYIGAKAALQVAQFNFEKISAGAPPDELEKTKIRLAQAKVALEKAKSGMRSQLQSFEAAVDREKANVGRARTLIEKADVRLKKTELRAPRDGLVVYAKAAGDKSAEKVQLGMVLFEGQPLIYLPDISTMVADTEVNEIDIGKVNLSGPVEVRLDAYPGAVFEGKILKIGSLAKLKQTRAGTATAIKVFEVTVKIDEKDPRLKPGLSATLDIIVDRQEDVISIPLSAVVSRRGDYFVFVSNGKKIEERKVVLGASNEQRVVVKEGLRPGEQVLLAPPPPGSS